MITYGIILLIIGIILWGVGSAVAPRPPARVLVIAGEVVGAIGLLLLLIGLVLYLIPSLSHGGPHPDANTAMALMLA